MLPRHDEPIVAIATAAGRGAVGIVRLSGRTLGRFAAGLLGQCPAPRMATLVNLADAQGRLLDRSLALFFPAPHSYTGEDVLELQVHGGPVLMQLLLARCLELAAQPLAGPPTAAQPEGALPLLPGLRLARPGEFTERAFLNDKLDLAQAEAVADLIDAGTEAAARSAARALEGEFSRDVGAVRDALVELRALVEATLDFPEEEIDFLRQAGAAQRLLELRQRLTAVQGRARQGALLRDGLSVVLAGQPNVGKSSLLNRLAGAELAIVTPVPGTTRDRIGQTIQIEGVPVQVIDTAGLRDATADEVERIGIERSWQAIEQADVVLFLHDLSRAGEPEYERAEAAIAAGLAKAGERLLHLHNKCDRARAEIPEAEGAMRSAGASSGESPPVAGPMPVPSQGPASPDLSVSALTGQGLDALRAELLRRAGWQALPEGTYIARQRHLQALQAAAAHLQAAQGWLAGAAAFELLAEELRLAHEALGGIVGRMDADALLGEIFGRFCIGK